MDPKEYAARLQRMRDEIETAKAREKISNGYNKAMETSPMEDTAERLYAEFKATEKPKTKPKAKVAGKPAAKKQAAPVGGMLNGKDAHGFLDLRTGAGAKAAAHNPEARRLAEGGILLSDIRRAQAAARAKDAVVPSQPVIATPPAEPKTPPEERVKGLTPAQAEAILSDAYSSRGKHGQYTSEETALIEALKAKAAGFDYGSVKQAPAVYVPSFLGVKK